MFIGYICNFRQASGDRFFEIGEIALMERAAFVGVVLLLCAAGTFPVAPAPAESSEAALGLEQARHLLARTTFGGDWTEIERVSTLSPAAAVRGLLEGVRTETCTPLPEWAAAPLPDELPRDMDEAERREMRDEQQERARELKAWWFDELLATDSPFTERMVLFWHNHFTSGLRKVKGPRLMLEQNRLLRRHAAGNFAALLGAIPEDAAMAVYLDLHNSRREQPNENFARELLELFTLGEGHYQEQDIREAARAFTGWRLDPRTGELRFHRRQHDAGEKVFLGKRGAWNGSDIVRILLGEERTAEFIVEKLWREFISERPDPTEVRRLAALFRGGGYELKPLYAALFSSPHFFSAKNRARLVKSPVELLVGTCRLLDAPMQIEERLPALAQSLGQELFDPPNVKGWPGGHDWIRSSTLLLREEFLRRLTRGQDMPEQDLAEPDGAPPRRARRARTMAGGIADWLASLPGANDAERLERARLVLLPCAPVQSTPADAALVEQVQALLLDPTYQLK